MEEFNNIQWRNRVAEQTHQMYESCVKGGGKPLDTEWTHLASILEFDNKTNELTVIALATGTKCLGANELDKLGDRVADSHAEILARRAFNRYLLLEILNAPEGTWKTNDSISFHMYTSHTPCGDASIVVKDEPEKKKFKEDVHRTGAKCVLGDPLQDTFKPGVDYHTLGALRTKPGRGPRTLSLSCSDKLARWTAIGLQSALLVPFLPQDDSFIPLTSLTIGLEGPYSPESIQRAIIDRIPEDMKVIGSLKFGQTCVPFNYGRSQVRIKPSPLSIVWIKSDKTR